MSDTQAALRAAPVTALITGGAGFLGRALLCELLGRAEPALRVDELRVLDTRPLPAPERDARLARLDRDRLRVICGDLRDAAALAAALRGVNLVFHCAAIVDWGRLPAALVREVNVAGTERLVSACRRAGVRALVHTSTLDVVYGGRPIRDGDESLPYPDRYVNVYCASKAAAEQLVLRADGSRDATAPAERAALRTTVIRPCCIWGEDDPYHIGSLLRMARRGGLIRVGDGRARCQHVYVGNVAHALVLAARSLLVDPRQAAAGQVYFATDFAARNFFDQFEPIIAALGYRMWPRAWSVPRRLLYPLACGAEALGALGRPLGLPAPTLSRFAVDFVCQDLTFTTDKAARELGYRPAYSEPEALRRTVEHFQAANDRAAGST